MRVAFLTVGDTTRRTGGYLYNARVIAGLRQRGVEVKEIVPCGAPPREQEEVIPRLERLLPPAAFDAVVVDALARVVAAPWLDRWRAAVPVVAMVHELPSVAAGDGGSGYGRELEEPLLRVDRIVAVSEHGRGVLERRGAAPARIRVVPPGFDRLPRGTRAVRGSREVRVLCVAQWIPRKGILTLVEAWKRLGGVGAVLELVGETDADRGYAAAVREAIGGDPSIVVRGAVGDEELAEAYRSADLFALPSRYEGYGMVYAEALAAGLPVVACRVGPVPELVGGEAAVLVPPGDAGALSGALERLVSDPALRERMSAAALRHAAGLSRWEQTIEGFLGVLREAVVERAGGACRSPV